MISLRPYQQDLVNDVRKAFLKHKRVIMQSPTGSGKTITFSYITQNAYTKGKSIMICSDRTEILSQNGGALEKFNVNPEYIFPRTKTPPKGRVSVCMLQTIQRRLNKPEWQEYLNSLNVVVIDEAHTQSANSLLQALAPNTYVIGATATPIRSSGQRQLGMDYNHIVEGCSVQHLIDLGYIVPCDHYTLDAPDLSSVDYDNKRGDFNYKQMSKVFERREKYDGVVKNWLRLASNTKTICFCASSEQAIEITKQFCEAGVNAKYLLSSSFDEDSMYSGKRSELIDELRNGDLTVLVNVGIAIAGLDVPALETCITAYATTSLSKWMQSLGRCGRPYHGKTRMMCLDFGGNVARLGFYEQDRKWGLWYESNRNGTSVAQTKNCPSDKPDIHGKSGCERLIPISTRECPFCGYYFANNRELYEAELTLVTRQDKDEETDIETWVANRVARGWNTNQILINACIKNSDNPKKAFFEVLPYVRKKDGGKLTGMYWKFFSENILKDKAVVAERKKKEEEMQT